jgi:hypothetical protein
MVTLFMQGTVSKAFYKERVGGLIWVDLYLRGKKMSEAQKTLPIPFSKGAIRINKEQWILRTSQGPEIP